MLLSRLPINSMPKALIKATTYTELDKYENEIGSSIYQIF